MVYRYLVALDLQRQTPNIVLAKAKIQACDEEMINCYILGNCYNYHKNLLENFLIGG